MGSFFVTGNAIVQNYPAKYFTYSLTLLGIAVVFIYFCTIYLKVAGGLKKLKKAPIGAKFVFEVVPQYT